MVSITHILHDTKAGQLKIELNLNAFGCETSSSAMVKMEFEDGQTGAFYDAEFSHDELCKICPIFHMREEIHDILTAMPEIMQDIAGPTWEGTCSRVVQFKYITMRLREYLVALPLKPREYPAEQKDIVLLRAENAVLRKKVDTLEQHAFDRQTVIARLTVEFEIHKNAVTGMASYLLQSRAMSSEDRHRLMLTFMHLADPELVTDVEGWTPITDKNDLVFRQLLRTGMADKLTGWGQPLLIAAIPYITGGDYPDLANRLIMLIDNMFDMNISRDGKSVITIFQDAIKLYERYTTRDQIWHERHADLIRVCKHAEAKGFK
jgi:hypothetical protein